MTHSDVSIFGGGRSQPAEVTPDLVGFKAYNLMRMDGVGLPVPSGFVLHTGLCRDYLTHGRLSDEVVALIRDQVAALEEQTDLRFGDTRQPLLVSVRSGAPVSMPGMMDTLLNIGLTDTTIPGFIRRTGNPHLAWDSYRRLVAMYAEVVQRVPEDFEAITRARIASEGLRTADELDCRALRDITRQSIARARSASGHTFPQDAYQQLLGAVEAVFHSWNGERAVAYRRLHGLQDVAGTAVIVQTMVFGNAGGSSGSGVGFTRNPSTGANELYFDFAFDAQGEDVVAGRHTLSDPRRLARVMPELYAKLLEMRRALELEFGDMQDFEFTVEDSVLYMLQTRTGKRTPLAAVRIAAAMVDEGLIDARTGLDRVVGIDLEELNDDRLDTGDTQPLATALAASNGVAVGPIALDSAAAKASAEAGHTPILVRIDTSTEDIEGFAAAAGILTATGGRTSHAAVIARQMAKVCLVACPGIEIDMAARTCRIGGHAFAEGVSLTLDGNTGHVYAGSIEVLHGPPAADLAALERLRGMVESAPQPAGS